MPQPTANRYPDAWHAAQDAQEQAWLNDWIRGRICLATLEVCPARQSAVMPAASLATVGRHS